MTSVRDVTNRQRKDAKLATELQLKSEFANAPSAS